ncbi:MAG TPA: Crp/Fnr family transcriptional regulator [Chitinophagaceae bacterium]|nr:Crp/Fnr family transcriptional regulator [Chitinophagaceae bacterium]
MEAVLRQFLDPHIQLSNEEMSAMVARMEVRHFPRRTMLIREGEQEKYLSLVAKGLLRKFFYKGKQEVITQLAGEGALISSSVSFFAGNPSQYYIETLEPVTLFSLSREALEDLYAKSHKMQRMGRLIITELYLDKERWEQHHICYDVKTRFMKFIHQHPDLLKRVPQKYLASYLNIKPETFSRLKHHLKPKPEVLV